MNWTLYLMLSVLSLYPGSVITREKQLMLSGHFKVVALQGSSVLQLEEERERARNESIKVFPQ